ncbi:uncharacterized protein LOC133385405 isoform X2 [Rhineura floridana]|uniref:uncharacterized protein LOC133385405 isoform X2 n=1 Tax=Rhineura floridana TaxID=261503 RepID=UPI002AC80669|nr:uncharacterized protein LOC133385405 isoform X2 [Rhineura floridana]
MFQQSLKSYSWIVPPLLISVWLAVYAGVGNAAKENTAGSSYLSATTHTAAFHTMRPSLEPLHPSVSQSPSKEKAIEGEAVVLGCRFQSSRGPSLNNLTVKWYKEDEKGSWDFMENNITVLANYTRAFMIGNLSEGDASLTILNVTINDHGTYFCQVILSSGEVVTGDGTKLRIRRALGLFGIEESIGTIIGVVAAGIGGLVVLIVILTPQLRKCLPCAKATSHQGRETVK